MCASHPCRVPTGKGSNGSRAASRQANSVVSKGKPACRRFLAALVGSVSTLKQTFLFMLHLVGDRPATIRMVGPGRYVVFQMAEDGIRKTCSPRFYE